MSLVGNEKDCRPKVCWSSLVGETKTKSKDDFEYGLDEDVSQRGQSVNVKGL